MDLKAAHVVADIRQGEVFGCIPHGARAYRFSRVEHVERVEVFNAETQSTQRRLEEASH